MHTEGAQFADCAFQRQTVAHRLIRHLRLRHLHPHGHQAGRPPAVLGEVIGDAADGVRGVAPNVPSAVPVKIHRVVAETGGYELAVAHGTRVGALELTRRTAPPPEPAAKIR